MSETYDFGGPTVGPNAYRLGVWQRALYYSGVTPSKPRFVPGGKGALIVTGGDPPDSERLLFWHQRCSMVVAADSGFDTALAAGLNPDWVVGDMDSTQRQATLRSLPESIVERHPRNKDLTDTELAIQRALRLGAGWYVLAGGAGGRLDHLLGIFALFSRDNPPAVWVTSTSEVVLVDSSIEIVLPVGSVGSVFPVGAGARNLTSRGLRWPLDGRSWVPGECSLSNEVVDSPVGVSTTGAPAVFVRELVSGRSAECEVTWQIP